MARRMQRSFTVSGSLHDSDRINLTVSGSLTDAVAHLRMLTPVFSSGGNDSVEAELTWPLLTQLNGQLWDSWAPSDDVKQWALKQVRRRTSPPPFTAHVRPEAPAPRDYQVEGARVIAAFGKALIFDEAGSGKTLTALLGLLQLENQGHLDQGPIVVITPNSVVDAWVAAVHTWTHWSAVPWRGSPKQRAQLLHSEHKVYVVGYGVLVRDAHHSTGGLLTDLKPKTFVVDEVHWIKNPQSLRSRAVRKLSKTASTFIGLSGTPITHHAGNLWPALYALESSAWPSRERFINRYLLTANTDYGLEILGLHPGMEEEFRTCLAGQHRRLAKADILPQLPPKVYSQRLVELPKEARRAYETMKSDMLAQLPQGGELPVMSVLAQLQRLLQLSCASADVFVTHEEAVEEGISFLKAHYEVTLRNPSWKINELVEVLEERRERQSVVFAPSAQLIRLAGQRLMEEGYKVGYITGRESSRTRTDNVDSFQRGALDVILATTGAGGVGITLTAADTVIFLQRPWSYVEAGQAEDRAHRLGSERHESVEIVDIIAKNTIDEHVREVLRGKAGALAELLEDRRIVEQCLGGL